MLKHLLVVTLLTATLPAVSAGARAQSAPAKDKATGLTVVPPAGYDVSVATPGRGQAARLAVKLPGDKDTGCQVAFSPAPQNGKFTQAQLDATMRGAAWQDAARKALSNGYDLTEAGVAEGRDGAVFTAVGDLKDRPGLPARAREVQTFFSIRETPKGRTSTVCVGERNGFAQRRTEFAAIAAGTTAP